MWNFQCLNQSPDWKCSSLIGELCAAGRPRVLLQFCLLICQLWLCARAELGATKAENHMSHPKPGEIQRLRCINRLPHTPPPTSQSLHRIATPAFYKHSAGAGMEVPLILHVENESKLQLCLAGKHSKHQDSNSSGRATCHLAAESLPAKQVLLGCKARLRDNSSLGWSTENAGKVLGQNPPSAAMLDAENAGSA